MLQRPREPFTLGRKFGDNQPTRRRVGRYLTLSVSPHRRRNERLPKQPLPCGNIPQVTRGVCNCIESPSFARTEYYWGFGGPWMKGK